EGKFRSVHNASPITAKLMASTFYSLLELADLSASEDAGAKKKETEEQLKTTIPPKSDHPPARDSHNRATLHYNIQIHLPATKDIEVYNAIFKSLKGHLLD